MQFDQLKRREFISLLGGASVAWPLAARAQQPVERMRRIGVLMNLASDDPEGQDRVAAFMQGLQRAAGYVDRILKGEKPADLPVQAPTKYELVINLKAAQGARARSAADAARPRRRGDRMSAKMKRRQFITLLGGAAAAWPLAARAQQTVTPLIGFLRSTPVAGFSHLPEAFRRGLREEGFTDGLNVKIEQQWAENRLDRLPTLAADLVSRGVAAITCNSPAVPAARAATATIPIVFVSGDDPVKSGFVTTLSRPTENLTGITFFGGSQLIAKRMELLRDLVPNASVIAVLADPSYPALLPDIETAGKALGINLLIFKARGEDEFASVFPAMIQAGAGAVLVSGGPFFGSKRRLLAALALRHGLPSIYDLRESVSDGGFMSYSASISDAYRLAGGYVGKLLKGAKPSELPVLQPSRFELVINLATAKALGLQIPPSIMLRADEVIE
jgi:putative ABC transport system substrate-binding protein